MDRPDREKIDQIFDGCYSQDLSACPNHTIFQRGKAVNEILPLIEEAKREERERILDFVETYMWFNYEDAACGLKAGSTKFTKTWQALGEK